MHRVSLRRQMQGLGHPRDYRDEIADQVDKDRELWREDQLRVKAARELPLIVLASPC